MSVDYSVLSLCVAVLCLGTLLRIGSMVSWGFVTMADCLEMDFDPACYSKHSNESTGSNGSEMWWPHEE